MSVIPNNQIQVNNTSRTEPGGELVCGTCGCIVASEHVQKHINWHATAGWTQATVTANLLPVGWN